MLMPLRELRAIYEVLFKDGVMVAKKDKRPQTKHPEIEGVSNLQVIRAMGSLKSRGYVKETFAWRHFYWYLTNEGIVYLRDYLHLPPEIVPASLQRIRKPAATLVVAHRTRVQTVEGPTSYVPKPGRRGESESQESLSERQGYRHRMMDPGEKESYTDRTPRFRGRPRAAEPLRPKAGWEIEDQPQPLSRRGDNFRSEAAMMEESRLKRVSRQQPDVSSEKPVTTSQERRVSEVQKQKAPISVQSQTAAWKQDVSQTTVTSKSSKTDLPLTVAAVATATGAATSKIQAEPSSPKTNKEKLKIGDEKASMKPRKMVTSNSAITTLPATELKEEKTQKVIVAPIKSAEVKATAERTPDIRKAQAVITVAAAQETSKLLTDTDTSTPAIPKPANKDVKEEKTQKVIVDAVRSADVKPAKTATDNMKDQAVLTVETSKLLTDTSTTVITVRKDVKEEKIKTAKVNGESVKPVEVKTQVESKIDHEKDKKTAKGTVTKETTKPLLGSTTGEPVLSTDGVKEICKVKVTQKPIDAKVTSVNLSAKPKTDEAPPKTSMVESSILEVKTSITTTTLSAPMTNAEDAKPVKAGATVTETIKKQEITEIITKQEQSNIKVTAHVKKDEKKVPEEVLNVSEKGSTLAQNDSSSPQLNQKVAATEEAMETKQVVEGSSKSKRKKKKSPGEIPKSINAEELPDSKSEKEKPCKDKPPEEVAEKTLQPTPVITSEPLTVCTSMKTEGPVEGNKTEAKIAIDGGKIKKQTHEKPIMEIPKQTEDQRISEVASLQLDQIPAVPPVELPEDAQVKAKLEERQVKC
ncbi:uncharacterized protein LOC114557377 [Perca flavescens]|uniref:uncharacterized protein LOC114557377 n=1 Tax=Perca flavescens TaxID=8167 RepID=UPI00106E5204|nr:uncharacterized protein LOC114557377 [Perca flavescens]